MSFRDLNLNNPLLNALSDLGLENPTPVQEMVFAPIMSGRDVLCISQTGTGKTYAYLLPLIRSWQFNSKRTVSIVIMVPTRELVVQVVEEFEKLAKYTSMKIAGAYGGTNIRSQMDAISEGVDVVVATPGRINDLILNRTIASGQVKKIVIDEVDEMLKLGFRQEITALMDLLPTKRQTLMFSATLNADIDVLVSHTTHTPLKIETASPGKPLQKISQYFYDVKNVNTKVNLAEYLLKNDSSMQKVLLFAHNKRLADLFFARLEFLFPEEVAVIHGNKNQNRRLRTVDEFENGTCRVLITTDLLARGLDVTDVTHVINADIPEIPEDYVHRIGRTGRAEKSGTAISFCSSTEKERLQEIELLMGEKIQQKDFPSEVEISDQLIPEEEYTPGMKIIQVKKPKVIEKGAAFHEKKDKNKKVPMKVTREDKQRLRLGKLYGTKHGGLGKGKKKK